MEHEGGYTTLDTVVTDKAVSFDTEHFSYYSAVVIGGGIMQTIGLLNREIVFLDPIKVGEYSYETAFCIQESVTMSVDGKNQAKQYTIYNNITASDMNTHSETGQTVTIGEDEFKMLKRMLWLYHTTYKNSQDDVIVEPQFINGYWNPNWPNINYLTNEQKKMS
ncbi:hypothetical protein P261_01389 [Lachnospiraceae bacterium TWA4]|nr:hypothetical protein P261_01389 [Lachnospiraceae bacterium TWA4]